MGVYVVIPAKSKPYTRWHDEGEVFLGILKAHYPTYLTRVSPESSSSISADFRVRTVDKDGISFHCTELVGMPHQCGIVIFGDWVYHGFKIFNEHVAYLESIAKDCLGYTKAMVTLVDRGKIKGLQDLGYVAATTFRNKRTDNEVVVLVKDL